MVAALSHQHEERTGGGGDRREAALIHGSRAGQKLLKFPAVGSLLRENVSGVELCEDLASYELVGNAVVIYANNAGQYTDGFCLDACRILPLESHADEGVGRP